MAKVILDTNFILSAIRNKVDFFEEILNKGHIVVISDEVVAEIKRLGEGTKKLKLKFKDEADLALKLLEKSNYEKVSCPGCYVDVGLRAFLKDHPDYILATMDKELKKSVANRKLVLRNKKKLELQ